SYRVLLSSLFLSLFTPHPLRSPLFPYTTLFRSRSPAAIAWLGLHPVIGLEVVNGGRNDALIGLGILGAILLVERGKLRTSGLVTGAAATIKATGALAEAGLAIWTWRRRGFRRAAIFAGAPAATVVAAYIAAGGP